MAVGTVVLVGCIVTLGTVDKGLCEHIINRLTLVLL